MNALTLKACTRTSALTTSCMASISAVPKGMVTMLLGRNGAGKTTTLRTIMGLWRASRGNIRFDGKDVTTLSTPAISKMGIAYVPEHMGIFADLTVKENMLLAAREAKTRRGPG